MISKEAIPQDIFHYTKMETALEKILSNKTLRINQIGLTNDPRESKTWHIPIPFTMGLQGKDQLREKRLVSKALAEIKKVMREEWKVLCFTLDSPIPHDTDAVRSMETYYFYRGHSRPRMWAQYAENHRGICLWFDGNELDKRINHELAHKCNDRIFRDEVRYDLAPGAVVVPPPPRNLIQDINNLGTRGAARNYMFEHYEWFFFRKHPDWETEAEFRWLVHSNKPVPETVSIIGAIKAVIVGCDFPKVYEPSLRSMCEELKIPAGRMKWENGLPIVDIESICKV